MPASKKMLRNQDQKANREAGIGDAQGRLPKESFKKVEVNLPCSICKQVFRMTEKNIEANAHVDSKHPKSTFAVCFPSPSAVDE